MCVESQEKLTQHAIFKEQKALSCVALKKNARQQDRIYLSLWIFLSNNDNSFEITIFHKYYLSTTIRLLFT
jgi:hypothetical protein